MMQILKIVAEGFMMTKNKQVEKQEREKRIWIIILITKNKPPQKNLAKNSLF